MSTTAQDEERTCLAALLTESLKYAITRIGDARARQSLWHDYQAFLASAPAATERDAMPWDPAPDATDPGARLQVPVARAAISQMLRRLAQDHGRECAQAAGTDIAEEMTRLEAGGEPDHTGMRQCSWCQKKWFRPLRESHIYCHVNCRTAAHRQRLLAAA